VSDPVAADFDRFAQLTGPADEDDLYHPFLLGLVPPAVGHALDLGCGTGGFTRLLAPRAAGVTAVDFSPEMLRVAAERSAHLPGIEWVQADANTYAIEPESYDLIVSLKTLHHLHADEVVPRLAGALRPGGLLLLHDVLDSDGGLAGAFRDVLASVVRAGHRLARSGRLRERRELREFWTAHARHDQHPTFAAARALAQTWLPGSRVYRHLMWRYTVVFRKDPLRRSAAAGSS